MMVIDVRYKTASPEQIQGVRMITLYTEREHKAMPEVVLQFDGIKPQRNIPLIGVKSITVTRD